MKICDDSICTGCQICGDVCPTKAITFVEDMKGFLHPHIESNCIKCNLCKEHCPALRETSSVSLDIECYAAWSKNNDNRLSSSSGGIFYFLAKEIIQMKGIVIGAAWNNNHVEHVVCKMEAELYKLRKSKYVQSSTKGIYNIVRKTIQSHKFVLFSGTPCQIAAINNYLTEKEKEYLYSIDVICHGIPNQKLLNKHIEYISSKYHKKVKAIDFRYKELGWKEFRVKISFEDNSRIYLGTDEDLYYKAFNRNYSLRDSCYNCKYSNLNRQSDITLGDFWNYYPLSFHMRKYENGISCILLNTKKGKKLFEKIKDSLVYESRSIKDALNANQSLSKSFNKNENYEQYWQCILENNYSSIEKVLNMQIYHEQKKSFVLKIKIFIKNHLYFFPKYIQKKLIR